MEVIEVTPREAEVLKFMAKGFSILDIAEELYCSDTTVRRDYENLYTKFAVNKHRELKEKYKETNIKIIENRESKTKRRQKPLKTSLKNIHKLAKELCC